MTDMYTTVAGKIIQSQEAIIGPLAWVEASKVSGLQVTDHNLAISGDGKTILERLVKRYEGLFGQASIEVCKDAVKELASTVSFKDLPSILQ